MMYEKLHSAVPRRGNIQDSWVTLLLGIISICKFETLSSRALFEHRLSWDIVFFVTAEAWLLVG